MYTAERLSASGTLTEAADVEVLVGRKGNSVQFTYEYVVYSTTTQLLTTEPTLTIRPISTVTGLGMFSATNQSCGKQWVDHCVCGCVM